VAALLREWLLGGVEGGRPERDLTVEVVDVDDELQEANRASGREGQSSMTGLVRLPT
jgi:hypothetical protein